MFPLRAFLLIPLVSLLLSACGGGGGGSSTDPAPTDTSPPTVPQNLSGVAVGQTQVDLSWTAATDVGGGVVSGYKVYRDSLLVASVTAGTSYSDVGLTSSTTYGYTVAAYDNAVPANESAQSSPVVNVTTQADTTPPTVPQNLSATVVSSSQVDLSWSASTDVGGGLVAGYRVYRDGAPVVSVTSGTSYSDTGRAASTTYSYTVLAYDNASPANESAQSSPPVSVTTPANLGLPLTYNFNTGDVSAWSDISDTGTAATWTVISGEYNQTVDVGFSLIGGVDQSYKLGAFSYLPALTALTAYKVSVDITPVPDTPTSSPDSRFDGKDVGVMFRYQDDNNYYRISFSTKESFARLEKKVGGVFTTLATNAQGYVENQTFNVVANLSGDLIQITRDGDPLFAVRDTSLPNGTVALYCQDTAKFDNVVIDNADPNPTLVVSTPLAHSVLPGTAVTGSAVVTNLPPGGSVDFEFGAVPCAAATESPPGSGFYTADCGTPAPGDYYLTGQGLHARLRNSSGGVVASDENLRIGVQGDSYMSVGDSIMLGIFDFFTGDNHSLDDRVIGKIGIQARLTDLLTADTGKPNIVFNEGIAGDRTTDMLTRIDSMLERHAGANRMLLMLGTNDSSGGTPTSQSLYQTNMQSLVDSARVQGKTVWVAKLPPVLPLASYPGQNTIIQGYNTAIDNLTNIQAGPDFYTFFYDDNGTPGTTSDDYERLSLYYETPTKAVHPNALGYQVMAQLWDNAISGATTMPFFLDRLCNRLVLPNDCTAVSPTNHRQTLMEVGQPAYVDATLTVTSIPAALANGVWIKTANAERNNTNTNYIDFTVDRPVTVYVAYDAGAASPPTWLTSNYVNTGLTVQTTDSNSPTLNVYSKLINVAGSVSLGGNLASGASGANSNYLVIVVPQ